MSLAYSSLLLGLSLPAINELSAHQSKPTTATNQKIQQLLTYVKTYPDAKVRYHASDMILHIDSDAAYLVMPGAKSRVAGYPQEEPTPRIIVRSVGCQPELCA